MKEDNDNEEVEFDWDEYLKTTSSEAAPKSCFRQHEVPPQNEFEIGKKLETVDPRNRTSMCIATVVDKLGPRIRLRLDGTDDRNDFWLLVDSEYIHPFEYTTKRGGQIQPPLGYRSNISTWPRFYDKIVHSAGENTFASDTCFKQPPQKPPKNEFKKGQKLEAVDQKNPHLICPATVKDIEKDNILVSFDGWSQQCNFYCHYASKDIFPVGWCKLTNHPLQLPGNFAEKRKSTRRSGGTTVATTNQEKKPKTPTPNQNNSLTKQPEQQLDNSVLNSSKPEETVVSAANDTKKQKSNSNRVDLSIVKTETIDNFEKTLKKNETHKNETKDVENQEKTNKTSVYINPTINCNKFLNSNKFHANYKQFGPDLPKNLFKLILQAFINCAYDSTKIFDLIQDGDSTSYIKFKTPNRNERKHLPKIENEAQLWTNLHLMCKLFFISENLFQKMPISETVKNIKNKITNNSRSDSLDSNSLNSLKQSINENLNNEETNFLDNSNKLKRRSSSDESYNQTKVLKVDIDNPSQWNVEQVINYVMQTDPNLLPHLDIIKFQEIDGKALLLLTTDVIMKYMGLKLGPALKLSNLIERLKSRH